MWARLTSCGSNSLARSLCCYLAAGLSDQRTSETKSFDVHIGSDHVPRLFCVEGRFHDHDPQHFVIYVVELGIVLVDCDDYFINKALVPPRRATNCGSVWPDWGCSGVGPFWPAAALDPSACERSQDSTTFQGGMFLIPPR